MQAYSSDSMFIFNCHYTTRKLVEVNANPFIQVKIIVPTLYHNWDVIYNTHLKCGREITAPSHAHKPESLGHHIDILIFIVLRVDQGVRMYNY